MRHRISLFDVSNVSLMTVLCIVFIYPVILTLSISFSETTPADQIIMLLPRGFTLDSYKFLLGDGRLMRYYANSVFYAASSTVVFLLLTSMMSYPFVIRNFRGKKLLNLYMVTTMFFSGGLIPFYFVVVGLGLVDNVLVMMIPGAVAAYNVIIFRTFFGQIPQSLRECAQIDGAGHFTVLFRIFLPISRPLLATFALFNIVGKWNDFFTPMLFLRKEYLQPVQMLLRRMLIQMDFKDIRNLDMQQMYKLVDARTVKCAAIILTITPVLCVYPFLQKYFAKGILVGAIKA